MRTKRFAFGWLAGLAAVVLAGCGTSGVRARRPAPRGTTTGVVQWSGSAWRSSEVRLAVPAANRAGAFGTDHVLRVPRGWRVEVWARVTGARLEQWTPEGDLLVSQPGGQIVELTPGRDRGGVPAQRNLLTGLNRPQGIAFDRVNGREILYVAETDQIDRYVWLGDRVGARTVLIPDLPSGTDHTLKNIVIGAHHRIFFDIGSTSNASPSPRSDPPFASVMEYTPAGRRIRVWAGGVRNGDGLSLAPDGLLWTAVNERDDIAYPFHRGYAGYADAYGRVIQAYVNNHPPDEIARLTPGRNLGWPYCNPDPDLRPGSASTRFRYTRLRFDRDVESNPAGRLARCGRLAPVEVGLPAHSAPLGFHFLEGSRLPRPWRSGAVVAVHGSWDRQPPRAPAVLWMPWSARRHTLGAARGLISGFQYPNGTRWGRPVDAVPGQDGALYVSDDMAGAIYRIVP